MFVMPPTRTHTHTKKKGKKKKRENKVLLRRNSQGNEIFQTNKKKTLFKNCTSIKKLQTLINYITDT